jgi:hypothetical protein
MKKFALLPLLALALALPATLRAQEFRMKFNSPTNRKVVLDMRGSDVTVEGYDGEEVLISRRRPPWPAACAPCIAAGPTTPAWAWP